MKIFIRFENFKILKSDLKKYAAILFWWAALPSAGIIALWSIVYHKSLVDNFFFISSVVCGLPFIVFKTEEDEDKIIANFIVQFQQMTTLEFAEMEITISKLPIGRGKSLIREAYRQAQDLRNKGQIF